MMAALLSLMSDPSTNIRFSSALLATWKQKETHTYFSDQRLLVSFSSTMFPWWLEVGGSIEEPLCGCSSRTRSLRMWLYLFTDWLTDWLEAGSPYITLGLLLEVLFISLMILNVTWCVYSALLRGLERWLSGWEHWLDSTPVTSPLLAPTGTKHASDEQIYMRTKSPYT